MKSSTKLGLVAGTLVLVAAGSARAQYNEGDLLLGFTDGNAAHADLVLDLGTLSALGAGTLNPSGSPGHVGLDAPGLLAELNTLYGGFNNVKWGIVGATFVNSVNNSTYGTVSQGGTAPAFGAPGNLASAVDTVGSAINDGSGPTANSQAHSVSEGFGLSWTEQIQGASSLWALNANPSPSFLASASAPTAEDLYQKVNGVESLVGTLTLANDGSLSFSPVAVPEPSSYGLLAGLGLLVVSLRRKVVTRS